MNLFTLMELKYDTGLNTKGLLKARADGSVERAKMAYGAAQRVFTIFDDTVVRAEKFSATAGGERKVTMDGYVTREGKKAIVAAWFGDRAVGEENETVAVDVALTGVTFESPVWVDLRTGEVREIGRGSWEKTEGGCKLVGVPLYDSPVLIAEKGVVAVGK